MTAELESFIVRRSRDDVLERSTSVEPGSSEVIDVIGLGRLLVTCAIDSNSARILLGKRRIAHRTEVRIYEDEADKRGKRVKGIRDISLVRPQELGLSIIPRGRRKPLREVVIYLSNDDEEVSDKVPQSSEPLVLV